MHDGGTPATRPGWTKEVAVMLNHPDAVVQFALLSHRELQIEGARSQRAKEACSIRRPRAGILGKTRNWLGLMLIAGGAHLLGRAGTPHLAAARGELNSMSVS
jgi:hypothetical protein